MFVYPQRFQWWSWFSSGSCQHPGTAIFHLCSIRYLKNISKIFILIKPIWTSYHHKNPQNSLFVLFISSVTAFQRQMKDEHDPITKMRRRNHTRIERQRRSEQRNLFDRLQFVLQSDPKTPRLHLLSQVSGKSRSARNFLFTCHGGWVHGKH